MPLNFLLLKLMMISTDILNGFNSCCSGNFLLFTLNMIGLELFYEPYLLLHLILML